MSERHPSDDIVGSRSQTLHGRRIAFGITGSVAAARSAEIARELMRRGAEVFAVMTPEAERLVHPNLLHWATGRPVVTRLTGEIEHVALAGNVPDKVDLVLVAPATANTVGKIAAGIDDTPVTTLATTALGEGIPLLLVPAMHEPMYRHPLVRRNIETLRGIGVDVMMPRLEEGKAKIPETGEIADRVETLLSPDARPLAGIRVLATAGRTVEYIDPVRVITNNSTGKMGVAVAEAARDLGAEVTLVCGKLSVPAPAGVRRVDTETAEEMSRAVQDVLSHEEYHIFFSVAAVGDWRPVHRHDEKVPTAGSERVHIDLEPTPKIVDEVRRQYPGMYVVAFRALYHASREETIADAQSRVQRGQANLIAVNDVAEADSGFEVDTNRLVVVGENGSVSDLPAGSKRRVAEALVELTARYVAGGTQGESK